MTCALVTAALVADPAPDSAGDLARAAEYLPEDQLTSDVQPVAADGIAYTDARYAITTP